MKLLNKFLLTLVCAATISSCNAITPEQQARINEQLGDAAWIGDLPGVKKAIAAGADIHARNDYALRSAAVYGRLPVVQYLLGLPEGQRANIHAENYFALRLAAGKGHLAIVKFLLEQGANIHADDDAALRWAARCGRLPVVQYLVEHGADIHAENDWALQWAAGNGHWIVAVYLLQQGADRAVLSAYQLNLLNKYIKFELQTALGHDDWHKVEELLSTVPVHELPQGIQQEIKNLLVPAVQKKLNSACLVLPITPIALRTLSFIVGPKTAAAFIYFIKENTHEITQ